MAAIFLILTIFQTCNLFVFKPIHVNLPYDWLHSVLLSGALTKNRPSYGTLKFDLVFDLVTYLFDLWPQNNDISMCGAILHMWTKIGDD